MGGSTKLFARVCGSTSRSHQNVAEKWKIHCRIVLVLFLLKCMFTILWATLREPPYSLHHLTTHMRLCLKLLHWRRHAQIQLVFWFNVCVTVLVESLPWWQQPEYWVQCLWHKPKCTQGYDRGSDFSHVPDTSWSCWYSTRLRLRSISTLLSGAWWLWGLRRRCT